MKTYAKLLRIDDNTEEEAVVSLGELELLCFVSYAPKELIEGQIYFIDMDLYFIDDIKIEESKEKNIGIKRFENGFKHKITGFLHREKIITQGIYFHDDYFLNEYSYLENKCIDIIADRIDISFLSQC